MVKKGANNKKMPSHRDLVKTVSKQMKYYFEIRRQEDGFDLSGPECPRPDYPALKSRPMLLYEGLHDRSVKHFYSDTTVKQKITHMDPYDTSTEEARRMQKLMKKTMDRVSYVPTPLLDFIDRVYHDKRSEPPWMGVGMQGGNTKYTKNSDKYVSGSITSEWKMKPRKWRRRGYGNPEPTLPRAFIEPTGAKPRMHRSCPSGWIDNKECNRLVNDASQILASSQCTEGVVSRPQSRPQSSKSSTNRSSQASGRSRESGHSRARSASPQPTRVPTSTSPPQPKASGPPRLIHRAQSGRNTLQTGGKTRKFTYHDAKDEVVKSHEKKKTSDNLKKGKIYYDIDGRRKPVPHKVKNDDGYLEKDGNTSGRRPDADSSDEKVPDWLRTQMRKQDVNEKRMPYNESVRSVDISEPHTARSEDFFTKREGVRRRPRSAKRTTSRYSRERDRHSQVTLSEGSYEKVDIDDSGSEEEVYYEDRGIQTGWELFVKYDQTENILYDGETESAKYKIIVRTGISVGASAKVPIHIVLYGSRGRSPDIMLTNCENHKIPFQQGAGDVFYVTCSYVGKLSRIEIGHNSDTEAWFLDSVSVHDPSKGEVYEFLCNKWLSVKTEDKMTRRQLDISASRKIDSDDRDPEEEEEEEAAEAIESVAVTNTPRAAPGSKTSSSSKISTSHLRNDSETVGSSKSKPQSSVSLPSETASTATLETSRSSKKKIRLQDPFVSSREPVRRGRRSPDNIDDFESDIALNSEKKSLSSRQSESSVTESDSHTARFEERSVLSQNTADDSNHPEIDRFEAFKAGQKAERERRIQEDEKKRQADISRTNDILRGPTVHEAAKSGDLARVKELLDHNSELKNSVDDRGNTPLHLATMQGHKDIVQFLAATGADMEFRDQVGYEPTHMAALHGHVHCLMVLVAMGAPINSNTDDSKTPLHLAAMSGNMETCKWLVANRSRLHAEDDFGRTPLDMAENNGHDDVARFLRTCINELKGKRTSLESLLVGKTDDSTWNDDRAERPIVHHRRAGSDSEDGESLADLRRGAREREEKQAKQKAYSDMQKKLADENMTYLDRIRYEVDNS